MLFLLALFDFLFKFESLLDPFLLLLVAKSSLDPLDDDELEEDALLDLDDDLDVDLDDTDVDTDRFEVDLADDDMGLIISATLSFLFNFTNLTNYLWNLSIISLNILFKDLFHPFD